jgi:hypothetical protein
MVSALLQLFRAGCNRIIIVMDISKISVDVHPIGFDHFDSSPCGSLPMSRVDCRHAEDTMVTCADIG